MPDGEGRHPAEILEGVLQGPSTVTNDVRAATWAEHAVGAAAGHATVLLAQLGRRPTLRLLLDDAPWRGAHGTAGDLSLNSFLPAEEALDWLLDGGVVRVRGTDAHPTCSATSTAIAAPP